MRRRHTCLDDELPDYVAGRLDPATRLHWDRHLTVCLTCQQQVALERRLRAALEGAPSLSGGLRSQLLALGAELPGPAPEPRPVLDPLPVLAPTATACHRSPRRPVAVAAAAVGASAAAVLGVAVVGGVARPAPSTPASGLTPAPASVVRGTATTLPAALVRRDALDADAKAQIRMVAKDVGLGRVRTLSLLVTSSGHI